MRSRIQDCPVRRCRPHAPRRSAQKIRNFIYYSPDPNQFHVHRRPVPPQGLSHPRGVRDRHRRGTGCGGRGCALDERRVTRTARTCGPDTPTLVSGRWINPPAMLRTAALRRKRHPFSSGNEHPGRNALLHFAPASMHPSMILLISALDRTPISATNTIRVRGIPAVGVPPGASVARPPAN